MLKKVYSSHSILQAYLQTINPSIETGVLLPRSKEGSSKCRCSKNVEESPSKPIQEKKISKSPKKKQTKEVAVSKPKEKPIELETNEPQKEVVSSKTGVFKRIKKITHNSRSSSDWSPSFSPSMIRKPHVISKGVVLREVPVPVFSSAKKRKVEDMAKHISNKQKKKL
ncbi:unnamed protein product [Lactuca saligna]|uniref:Uncharacterized protein n=1 Tax=Lactuca saligna TaxID=75948 RepID=A0AA36E3I1_LACSI|nr:unnamed protein product [Lactuca saligna]